MAEAFDKTGVQYSDGGYNMASWGIATSMVLIGLTVVAWIGGGIYSMVKK